MLRLTQWLIKHFKATLIIWLIIFASSIFFAFNMPSKLSGDGFKVSHGDSTIVNDKLSRNFHFPNDTILIVFENKTDNQIESVLEKVSNVDGVQKVQSPLDDQSQYSKHLSYAILPFDDQAKNLDALVTTLRTKLKAEKGVTLTGNPVISKDINTTSQNDLIKAEAIGLPFAIIVLLFAFGTIVASILPIIIGIITIVTTFATLYFLSAISPLSVFILNIVPMLGLAINIDFSLLFISRYKEERLKTSNKQALQTTMRTAGKSILSSALCVAIGLSAMALIDVQLFQNIALGGAVVVIFSVLTALTLLPVILLLLGDKIDRWSILKPHSTKISVWYHIAQFVTKRPIRIALLCVTILCVALIPSKEMKLIIPQFDALPKTYDARIAYEKIQQQFGLGKFSTVYVIAKKDGGFTNDQGLQQLLDLQNEFLKDSLVLTVDSYFEIANVPSVSALHEKEQNKKYTAQLADVKQRFFNEDEALLMIKLDAKGDEAIAKDFVRNWSNKTFDAYTLQLGGNAKFNQEIFDEISQKIGWSLLLIFMTTFIILMFAFRSILIPLKAILMNILGLCATFGIVVYLFQYGHLGLEPQSIVLIIPVITFCLVFGLSMDYEVFLISRIHEAYMNGATNTEATITGLATTSRVITAAALIMIVLTGAFVFTQVSAIKQIGVSIALAIAIDATIIRLFLVPSLMKLFGPWNWWYPFQKRKN